jgi:peptide/nickel transport system permease protein
MARYLAGRLLQMLPLLVGISFLLFFLLSLAPGDPVDMFIMSDPNVDARNIEALKHAYGLDQPMIVRYVKWLGRTVRGDLGWSIRFKQPVSQLIAERLPNTLALTMTGFILALLLAVPVGIYAALRQYSLTDYVVSFLSFLGFSVPLFWFGIVMIYIFAVNLRWVPPGGFQTTGVAPGWPMALDRVRYMLLPAAVVAFYTAALLVRYVRSSMLEALRQDYIRTARSKGLRERTVINKHALRNALMPLVTILSLAIPALFGGAPVTETVFGWPGTGQLLVQSVLSGDHIVSMAMLMIIAVMVVAASLVADLAYAWLDPRIRYE